MICHLTCDKSCSGLFLIDMQKIRLLRRVNLGHGVDLGQRWFMIEITSLRKICALLCIIEHRTDTTEKAIKPNVPVLVQYIIS